LYILRWGSHILERSTPAALIVGGAAVALTLPPVRRGLRATAVLATRGILMVADKISDVGASLQETAEDLIAEAREPVPGPVDSIRDRWASIRNRAKRNHHKLAVTAAGGYHAAKERIGALRENLETLAEEARQNDDEPNPSSPANTVGTENGDGSQFRDSLEADTGDIGKPPKRARAKKD
jgi:hypothetical protein